VAGKRERLTERLLPDWIRKYKSNVLEIMVMFRRPVPKFLDVDSKQSVQLHPTEGPR
jgi:hypothetical protein